MTLKETLLSHISLIGEQGFDYFNRFATPFTDKEDKITERVETMLWSIAAVFIMLMVMHKDGMFYAVLKMPFFVNLQLLAGYEELIVNGTVVWYPETGIHLTTLITHLIAAILVMGEMRKRGIPPIQNLMITFSLTFVAFILPFEWIYTIVYDLTHNLPVEGRMAILTFGFELPNTLFKLQRTVLGRNTLMTVLPLILVWLAVDSIPKGKWKMFNFDKTSKILLSLFIIGYLGWIFLPLYTPITSAKGLNLFPQTIYVWYGYEPYYMNGEPTDIMLFNIIHQEWHPNLLIKVFNVGVKCLSVAWCFYTFTPRRIDE